MPDNPNTNCLEGMCCSMCGHYGPFKIEATVSVTVHDNGTEDDGGDYEWDDGNRCECLSCHHIATIAGFTEALNV